MACAAMLAASSFGCVGPRAPSAAHVPFAVRVLGASDGALLGTRRDGRSVFAGASGRDFAIEVTNDTSSEVGVAIVIDGLDAKTGEPVPSCANVHGWVATAHARIVTRGFRVAESRIAGYRFAPPDRALAAITRGGRKEAIGTIEVCFFSLRPLEPSGTPQPDAPASFEGVVESDPTPEDTPVVGELRDEAEGRTMHVEHVAVLSRIVVSYESEDGAKLGTAPPPAGIARVDRGVRDTVGQVEEEKGEKEEEEGAPPKASRGPKGTKPVKPVKPVKDPKPTKPTKDPKPVKGSKPVKDSKGRGSSE